MAKDKTLDDFLAKNPPHVLLGVEYYIIDQISKLLGLSKATTRRYIDSGFFEEHGAHPIRHPFNEKYRLVPKNEVISLYLSLKQK